ncbi:MAG: LapA family protein [Nitrospira sp.]|nr:LapA family protein [Nitrospira sp.]
MAYLFLSLILALLTAAFALQNTEAVTVRLLLWEYQTSLVLVILGSTISGALLSFLASLGRRWKRSRTIRSLESTVESQGMRIRELEARLTRSPENSEPSSST